MDTLFEEAAESRIALVVLAAGAGTRLSSALPKPLHPVAGLPMISHVLRAAEAVQPVAHVIVASHALAQSAFGREAAETMRVVVQDPPQGTGDAVRVAVSELGDDVDWILVLYADHPLVTGEILRSLVEQATATRPLVSLLTCEVDNAAAYGRIERDAEGLVCAIIEAVDDDPSARVGSVEINSGIMLLDASWARDGLTRIPRNKRKHEYFLTDIVGIAVQEASAKRPAVMTLLGDPAILVGVNDRVEQAVADAALRDRIRRDAMLSGVTLVGPETIFIDADVAIGSDTTILPYSYLLAGTTIGQRCSIGPTAFIERSEIGNDVRVTASFVRNSAIRDGSDVGPYSHLRNGTVVESGAHIGNFAEIKASHVESSVRIGHFSYLGDASIGEGTNIGAGTVTCNYDGTAKHRTEIGSNAFIGSDTMLVAPVVVGDGSATGAGSVVTKDVPPGAKVVGVPARAIRTKGSS
jgi:bifunctional UDP-N-acetylglucosamine pyrophosphorylase / glucosamine-1-phosphate N-acetyltransferase